MYDELDSYDESPYEYWDDDLDDDSDWGDDSFEARFGYPQDDIYADVPEFDG